MFAHALEEMINQVGGIHYLVYRPSFLIFNQWANFDLNLKMTCRDKNLFQDNINVLTSLNKEARL